MTWTNLTCSFEFCLNLQLEIISTLWIFWLSHVLCNLCIFNSLYWILNSLTIRAELHLFWIPCSTKHYPLNIDVWNIALTHNFFLILPLYPVLSPSPLTSTLSVFFFFINCLQGVTLFHCKHKIFKIQHI